MKRKFYAAHTTDGGPKVRKVFHGFREMAEALEGRKWAFHAFASADKAAESLDRLEALEAAKADNAEQETPRAELPKPKPEEHRHIVGYCRPVVVDECEMCASITDAASALGYSYDVVYSAVKGKRKRPLGHSFRYATDAEARDYAPRASKRKTHHNWPVIVDDSLIFNSCGEAAEALGLRRQAVAQYCEGFRSGKATGHTFRYATEEERRDAIARGQIRETRLLYSPIVIGAEWFANCTECAKLTGRNVSTLNKAVNRGRVMRDGSTVRYATEAEAKAMQATGQQSGRLEDLWGAR